jgi:hypothetical protein
VLIVIAAAAVGERRSRVLDANAHHLGRPGEPEWQEFEGKSPNGRELKVTFAGQPNDRECTLFIRQRDVKLGWSVLINGRKLGQLHTMEQALVHVLPVPPGTLRDGENILTISPPAAVDDVIVGEIKLDARPVKEALGLATINVQVMDAESTDGLPCRITIVDKLGALAPIYASPDQQLAVRPGVVYTRDGRATLGVQPGEYTVFATRGFEYSMDSQKLSIAEGHVENVHLRIRREVPTPGLVSCDTHIHTLTHSGHGDATIDERMITIAGEGIELAVATEHNHHADYSEPARRSGVQDRFTTVIGNEVTTKKGHFNAFPIRPGSAPPDYKIEDWPPLMRAIRSTPGVRVVVLNHPRNIHSEFQPFGPTNYNSVTGENRRGPEFTFDAVEVVTSAALQTDPMIGFRDWFALLNHGYRVAGVGSSDSHDVSRFILGQGRTYVACAGDNAAAIDVDGACDSFLKGRVLVSMGLLTEMTVNERFGVGDLVTGLGNELRVNVVVRGPLWVTADRVELFANGVKFREQRIEPTQSVEKARITWTIPRPAHDVHLVAIATGPGVTAPYWANPKPFQPTSRVWEPRVIGATNPVWIDADDDGRFTSPRGYATMLLNRAGPEPAKLIPLLDSLDQATATQVASLCHAAGRGDQDTDWERLLKSAPAHVRTGFLAFLKSTPAR